MKSRVPYEIRVLIVIAEHFAQFLPRIPIFRWFEASSFRIGAFVMFWILAVIISIFTMLTLGVNPTLILSVLAAPFWVIVVLLCWRLSGYLMVVRGKYEKEENHPH